MTKFQDYAMQVSISASVYLLKGGDLTLSFGILER